MATGDLNFLLPYFLYKYQGLVMNILPTNWQSTAITLARYCHTVGKTLPFQWQGAANCNGKTLPMQLAKYTVCNKKNRSSKEAVSIINFKLRHCNNTTTVAVSFF